MIRCSNLVSICSYSSFMDESEEMVEVGVVEESTGESGVVPSVVVGCTEEFDA